MRRFHELCAACLNKDLEIQALTKERDESREHAVRWEHEAHTLRKEIQRLRMECDTERIANREHLPHDFPPREP